MTLRLAGSYVIQEAIMKTARRFLFEQLSTSWYGSYLPLLCLLHVFGITP